MPDEDGNILVTLHFETLYIVYHMIQCAANSATTVLSDVYVVHSSRGNMTIIIYLLYTSIEARLRRASMLRRWGNSASATVARRRCFLKCIIH